MLFHLVCIMLVIRAGGACILSVFRSWYVRDNVKAPLWCHADRRMKLICCLHNLNCSGISTSGSHMCDLNICFRHRSPNQWIAQDAYVRWTVNIIHTKLSMTLQDHMSYELHLNYIWTPAYSHIVLQKFTWLLNSSPPGPPFTNMV